jgi:hypothetical protein
MRLDTGIFVFVKLMASFGRIESLEFSTWPFLHTVIFVLRLGWQQVGRPFSVAMPSSSTDSFL